MSLSAAVSHPAEPFFPSGVTLRQWRLLLAAVLVVYACVQFFYITATPLQTATLPDNLPNRTTRHCSMRWRPWCTERRWGCRLPQLPAAAVPRSAAAA